VAAFVSNAGGSNFYSDNGTTLLSTGVWATTLDGEVVPVPEPITWLAGALVFGALGWMQRRRLRAPLRRAG